MIWPAGFTARGNPVGVYNSDGVLFAVAGQQVTIGGGRVLSSRQRQAMGCAGISQSIVAGPLKSAAEALPGSDVYADSQVGEMQDIVMSHRSVFGGLWGDPSTHVVTIYIAAKADKQASAAGMAQILAIRPWVSTNPVQNPWRVGFITAGPSLAELEVVQGNLTTAQPWATDVGNHLVSWGIDAANHAVKVGVDLITPTISQDALAEFGGLVIIETSEPAIAD